MFRIAVCDCDEKEESRRVFINKTVGSVFDRIKVEISYFTDGENLIASLKNEKPYQLVFMGTVLKDMRGFDAVKRIKKITPEVDVVYVLPGEDYSLKESGAQGFDYFVKPVSPAKLRNALSRRLSERFCVYDGYLNVCFQRSIKQIPLHRVYYFERIGRKLAARMKGDDSTFCGKLDDIEKPLLENGFIRCHKSFIINADTILKMDGSTITLLGGRDITVSRTYYDSVCEELAKRKIPITGEFKK